MTTQEIISMAREAGCEIRNGHIYNEHMGSLDQMLKRFAKLVAEKEREQCALLCEEMKYTGFGYEPEAPRLAKKIRARGNQ